jgi:hypothetical protein
MLTEPLVSIEPEMTSEPQPLVIVRLMRGGEVFDEAIETGLDAFPPWSLLKWQIDRAELLIARRLIDHYYDEDDMRGGFRFREVHQLHRVIRHWNLTLVFEPRNHPPPWENCHAVSPEAVPALL